MLVLVLPWIDPLHLTGVWSQGGVRSARGSCGEEVPCPEGLEGNVALWASKRHNQRVWPGCRVICRAGVGWQVWQEAQSFWRVTVYPGTCLPDVDICLRSLLLTQVAVVLSTTQGLRLVTREHRMLVAKVAPVFSTCWGLKARLRPASGDFWVSAADGRVVSCPQAVGPGGVHSGPVQIVNNKFLAWSGVMEWQEVSYGGCVGCWP